MKSAGKPTKGSDSRRLVRDISRGLALVMGGILACFALALGALSQFLTHYARDSNAHLASAIASGVEQLVLEPARDLRIIQNVVSDQRIIAEAAIPAYLATCLRELPWLGSIQVLDDAGVIRHTAPGRSSLAGISLASTDYLVQVRNSGLIVVTDTFSDPRTGLPATALVVRGQRGYIVGQLDLGTLNKSLQYLDQSEQKVAIVDAHDTYILHPDNDLVLRRVEAKDYYHARQREGRKDISFPARFLDEDYLSTAYPVPALGWTVLVSERQSRIQQPTLILTIATLLASITSAALALILLRSFSRRLGQHLDAIGHQADQIAHGNYQTTIARGPYRELNHLAHTLLLMRDRVQLRESALQASEQRFRMLNEHLEIRVAERSAELDATRQSMLTVEKMAALGQLVAGIAHELNTPLAAISSSSASIGDYLHKRQIADLHGFADLPTQTRNQVLTILSMIPARESTAVIRRSERKALAQTLSKRYGDTYSGLADELAELGFASLSPELNLLLDQQPGREVFRLAASLATPRRAAALVASASAKAGRVIQALRHYTHPGEGGKHSQVDLDASLSSVLTLFENRTRTHMRIERQGDAGLWLNADPDGLSQVWTNLIANACQATEYRGQLLISTGQTATQVFVCFQDNGPGISDEVQPRIFEPFFTTKGIGEGSGLGLTICHRIVAAHNGSIDVESRPGCTRFTVRLPKGAQG